MKIMIAIAFCLTSSIAFAQDHATSVEQCQADLNLWRSQLTDYLKAETIRINTSVPNKTEVMKLNFAQLNDRAYELGQCAVIEPDKEDAYNEIMRGYSDARNDRYIFFVERHQLKKQMLAEDASGKRN